MTRTLHILGIRGLPAAHGGFETFAERLALHLVEKQWQVIVYCQEQETGRIRYSEWQGIHRVHVPVSVLGVMGTILFDFLTVIHASRQKGLFLTLGYNTAIFNGLQRLRGQVNLVNMDGMEWRRAKWGVFAKAWLWLNERAGCLIGNHLIADHPMIAAHLGSRVSSSKITMIPYGADEIRDADVTLIEALGFRPGQYSTLIARPEPENSVLEIVQAFSRKRRAHVLVVLGNFSPDVNPYHRKVMDAASAEVLFLGAIYDTDVVRALRFFSRSYVHGHQVGGTNPSLVEALGAGCAVAAHDNRFNRWVAGPGAMYFKDENACSALFDDLLSPDFSTAQMKEASRKRFNEQFTWKQILSEYEKLLESWHPRY